MKIILASDLSIKNELKKIALEKKIDVEEKIALNIQNIDFNQSSYESYVSKANNIIFQSKNAVKFSALLYDCMLKNKTAKMYCLGRFTGKELQRHFANEVIYPKDNYSSENLAKIIKDNKDINESYLIIKGEGGRDYLENEIKGFAEEINVISVYKRVPIKDFLSESCVSNSANNYLIVSSKTALIELISSVSNYKKNASLVLIVPNERIINGIDKKIFRDIIIICNSSSAETYINTIVKHNEQN